MQREDVERLAIWTERTHLGGPDIAAALRALLAERDALQGQLNDLRNGWANSVKAHAALLAERDAAYTQGYSDAEAEISQTAMGQKIEALSKQNAEYRAHVKRLTAERDAAFAAGQEEMRERAAEAVLYLGRMKEMRGRGVEGPEVAHLIRALPIKDKPDE